MSERTRMVVVGLDGACWDLIEPLIRAGDLPTIRNLRNGGSWGPLASTVPPVTCPAWKCYSTGKNPGKLGVFWWQHIDVSARAIRIPSADWFGSKELWDQLNQAGIRTGVMGMPMTYPPRDLHGFMVAGGPDCASRCYARPADLERTLRSWGYHVHPSIEGRLENGSPLVDRILEWIELQFEVAERLLVREPLGFLQITIFYLNWLQHRFYDGEPVRKAWKLIDRRIARLVDRFEYVVIVSDHGTAPMRKVFFLNVWLEKNGYLRLAGRCSIAECLYRFGINKERVSDFCRVLRLGGLVSRSGVLKSLARRCLLDQEGLMSDRSGSEAIAGVDWTRTLAIALPQGPIFLNRDLVRGEREYERLRDRLIEEIEGIEDPDGGKPITKVYRREEIYHGEHTRRAPDLVALDADEYHNRGGLGRRNLFQESDWAGNNARHGLFLIRGPGVREGFPFDGMRIYDLAPTILHLMRAPVLDDVDGLIAEDVLAR